MVIIKLIGFKLHINIFIKDLGTKEIYFKHLQYNHKFLRQQVMEN